MKAADPSAGTERPLMHVTVHVRVTDSPDKLVTLPTEDHAVAMGMHDELADFYGATPGSFTPHASTLDYVVGALGACLASTFKRALAARGIKPDPTDFGVEAIGEIVVDGDVPVIRRVEVRYVLSGTQAEDPRRSNGPTPYITAGAPSPAASKQPSTSPRHCASRDADNEHGS